MNRLIARIFPRPPTQWPKYAHECGWAPKPDNPTYPMAMPPKLHGRVSKMIGGVFWFFVLYRAKQDGAHEILGVHPWLHEH